MPATLVKKSAISVNSVPMLELKVRVDCCQLRPASLSAAAVNDSGNVGVLSVRESGRVGSAKSSMRENLTHQEPKNGLRSTNLWITSRYPHTVGRMKLALVQMKSGSDKLKNLAAVEKWAVQAKDQGAELAIFPEATMKAFQAGRLDTAAEPLDGPWANRIRDLADELGITIVVGMFTPADTLGDKNRVANTVLVAGSAETHYDKIHTYDAFGYRESDTVRAGSELVTFELSGHMIGVATCYDIRFPEQFKGLARRGAELIVVPASWADGDDKLRQWRLLTNARGLDSTCYIAAVGQARPDADIAEKGGPTGIGHSALVSPTGERLAEAGYDEELMVVDVDFDVIADVRKVLPVIEDIPAGVKQP